MAVKQQVVECVGQTAETRLQILLRTLQHIEDPKENKCVEIVASLGAIQIPRQPQKYVKFIEDIKRVQAILEKHMTKELIVITLRALYHEISTADKVPSPVMSIVLQLIDTKVIPTAVDYILQTSGSTPASLKRALCALVTWLTKWTYTENLGLLVFTFIQGVENQQHYDILYDVIIDSISQLFRLLVLNESRKGVGLVVLYILTSQGHQNNPDVFHKIIPDAKTVVDHLYKENSESSLLYLHKIVSVCDFLMNHFSAFSHLYIELREDLQPYLPTGDKQTTANRSYLNGDNSISIYTNNEKVGLNNLGNTCYMNSVLQALFMTKPFRNEVLRHSQQQTPLFGKLQSLFALLQHSSRSSLSPNDVSHLARPPGFLQGHQHDSSEFLGYLLDVLHEQEKNMFAHNTEGAEAAMETIVQTTFGGRTGSVSRCGDCGTKSERFDNFRELQLSIPNGSESQSVQTLLDYYLTPEKLSGDNQYYCDVCDRLTDGERITCIAEAPRRLILTLKHFRYDPKSQQRTKLLQSVRLDSNVRLEQGYQYELYAAVVHCGSSVDSGHYYTFARADDGVWFKFNDCSVTQTVSEVMCGLKPPETPYILFYRRLDCSDPETLPRTVLSQRLQMLISKDHAEYQMEKRKRPLNLYSSYNKQNRSDEPPPPGCGGSGFSNNSSNMYVC